MNRRDLLALVCFVGACFAASGAGQLAAGGFPDDWYAGIRKPSFTPPGWLFAPVWTVLYAAMGVAAWLVWRGRGLRQTARPLALFAVQLMLNAVWTPLFFGLRSPLAGLIDIVALWGAIVAATWLFLRVSRPAGALMVPYLAWVSYAAILNAAIWRLNA